jgi:hypothetical protein
VIVLRCWERWYACESMLPLSVLDGAFEFNGAAFVVEVPMEREDRKDAAMV